MIELDATERAEVQAARIAELVGGEISEKEFVSSLISQCKMTINDAHLLLAETSTPAIKIGDAVYYPVGGNGNMPIWRKGRVQGFYSDKGGVLVQTIFADAFSTRVPFPRHLLRRVMR